MSGSERKADDQQAGLTRVLARLGNTLADEKDAKPRKVGEVIQFPLFPEDIL
jgi:hypothetical protein